MATSGKVDYLTVKLFTLFQWSPKNDPVQSAIILESILSQPFPSLKLIAKMLLLQLLQRDTLPPTVSIQFHVKLAFV